MIELAVLAFFATVIGVSVGHDQVEAFNTAANAVTVAAFLYAARRFRTVVLPAIQSLQQLVRDIRELHSFIGEVTEPGGRRKTDPPKDED